MLYLIPQSIATTSYLWLGTRDIQRFLQLTRETMSCGHGVAAMRASASSRGVSTEVIITRWLPSLRMMRVSIRVSTPSMPGIACSSNTSLSVFV